MNSDDAFDYINTNQALAEAATEWLRTPILALDTEFIRTDTFYPRPALVQVSNGTRCWLIDVLGISDFSPLAQVMTAANVLKVLHAPGEDLEVFDRLCGCLPSPLFDTQTAASFCGYGSSIGYSRLVQQLLDIELDKEQSRSDWLARPLSPEQLHYACLDVLHLPVLHHYLHTALSQQQRVPWAEEESRRQLLKYREQRDTAYSIDRIQHVWKLDEAERQRLWNLLLGRDALARKFNKPRNHIARDHVLMDMARRPPNHTTQLSRIDGLHPSAIRQWGSHLIQLANEVPAELLTPRVLLPLSKLENNRAKALRSLADQIAAGLALPAELLVRRQEIESLARHARPGAGIPWPERFTGWRRDLLCSPFADQIASWHATGDTP